MTVEKKIEGAPLRPVGLTIRQSAHPGGRPGSRQIGAFLDDIEPFFCFRSLVYVDVGAHRGDIFAELFRSPLKIAEAHLVEPNPRAFEALERHVGALKAAQATCHHLALADGPGRLALRDAGTMTKVVAAAGEGRVAGGPQTGGPEAASKIFEVEASTLDDLAQTFTTPHISLLKIDVEGYETQVLSGARRLLEAQAVDLVYIEAGLDPAGTQQTYYRAIEDLLRSHGYRLFQIYEQKHEWLEDSPLLRRANFAFMSAAFAARNPYRLSRELMALRKEKEALAENFEARLAEIAKLTELLENERSQAEQALEAERKAAERAKAERQAAKQVLEAERKAAEQALEAERKAAERAEAERNAAKQALAAERARANSEIAGARVDRRAAEAERAGRQAAEARLGELEAQRSRDRAKFSRELGALKAYCRTLEKRHVEVLESETWRAMEPVRRTIRFFRGRPAAAPFVPRLTGSSAQTAAKRQKPADKSGAKKDGAGKLEKPVDKDEAKKDGAGKLGPVKQQRAAEVTRYLHHLWAGLSQPAVQALSRVVEDIDYNQRSRFDAAHKLATWHAFNGDHETALAMIRAIDRAAPDLRDAKERWIKEGFIHYARGDREAGRAAFAHFLATEAGRHDPDASLALTNALSDDDERIAGINRVLDRAGFVGLERIDPGKPLAIDNIRGGPTASRIGDFGCVSVIVPAYDAAHSIGPALASLCAQSYADLEILVVDDASSDGTADVVAGLARADRRIRLIRQERNGGAYPARNRGLAEATGRFVTTHDADDWSHPQKIETQLAHLAAEPQVAGVCTHWVRVRPSLEMKPNWRIGERIIHWNHSSFLFRREVVDALGPWDPIRVGADTEMIWRVQAARGARSFRKIAGRAPLAFALHEETSLTRMKETHVRSIYFGLRQIYRAGARHSHAHAPDPGQAAALRRRAAPAALLQRNPSVALDFLLIGDCTNPARVEEMRGFIDGPEGRGARVGLFHWPDFEAPPRDLCPGYCALVARGGVEPVPPGARIALPRRYGIFFGHGHREIDQFPVVEADTAALRQADPFCSSSPVHSGQKGQYDENQ